jgi:hypothetical protein
MSQIAANHEVLTLEEAASAKNRNSVPFAFASTR